MMLTTYETTQPWVVYRYLTHDGCWPPWSSTRFLGRSRVECECAICGDRRVLSLRIPRFGPVPEPEGGRHPQRVRFLSEHLHPDRRRSPLTWTKPLLNAAAHR